MRIEILGTGCAKCRRLEKYVKTAVEQLGIDADVVKIDDVQEMIDRGIMMTPALYVDGKAVSVGRVPGVEEIKDTLGRE